MKNLDGELVVLERFRLRDMSHALVLSDIDGTIVRNPIALSHAIFLHEEGIMNLGEEIRLWNKDKKNDTYITFLAEEYRRQLVGHTKAEVKVLEFMEQYLEEDGNFYHSVLNEVKGYAESGANVVLVSGSPSYLVSEFAHKFNIPNYFSSIYLQDKDKKFTGSYIGMFSSKSKKAVVNSLELEGVTEIVSFGDTKSDIPLLEVAHVRYMVEPNHEARSHAPEGTIFLDNI